MQEEFEKKIRERVHTFGIRPSREVWDEIGVVLDKKKRRRVFVGWWILLGLAVFGGSVLLYEKDSITHDSLNQQLAVKTDTTNNSHVAQQLKPAKAADNVTTEENKNDAQQNNGLTTPPKQDAGDLSNNKAATASHSQQQAKLVVPAKALLGKSSFSFNASIPVAGDQQLMATTEKLPGNVITPQADATKNTSDASQPNSPAAGKQPPTRLLNRGADSLANTKISSVDSTSSFVNPNKAFSQSLSASPTGKAIGYKRHRWFLTFSLGSTQTISLGAFNTSAYGGGYTAAVAPQSFANIPGITALNAFKYNLTQPSAGFHISAGILYEKQLSPSWQISGGTAFSYLSNTQKTGLAFNGPLYASANLTSGLPVQAYYQSGSSGTVVNKAWDVQVPLYIGYVLNPKAKTQFILNPGLSFAWLFSSEWLIPDAPYGKLYYNNAMFNNTAINWQLGAALQLHNGFRVGLQYQQSFTTLAKTYVAPRLYWQNISIYTAIPLGRKKKH